MQTLTGVFNTYRLLIKAIGKKQKQGPCLPSRRKAITQILLALLLLTGQAAISDQGEGGKQQYHFNLPTMPVDKALQQIAQQTGKQLVFSSELVGSLTSPGINGHYTVEQALSLLLNSTSLTGSVTERGVIVVVPTSALKKTNEGSEVMKSKKNLLAATVAFFVGGGVNGVLAEEKVNDASGFMLEEVVVTAQKRAQDLQDVALAVTAFSAADMEARGINSAEDLQFSVPGLTLGKTNFGSVQVTMRGVGTENVFPGGDPGVPMHIDGHYVQSSAYMLRDLFDVERIEVLRGPQGTLYGRNAIGGSINIISNKPSDELEGMIRLDIGNYDKRLVQGVISGPLSDRVRARLAVSDEERDGYVDNISPNGPQDLEDSDYTSIRGGIEFDVTDDIQVYLSGYHYDDSSTGTISVIVSEHSTEPMFGPFINHHALNGSDPNITVRDVRKVRFDTPMDQSDEAEGVALDVDWDLGSVLIRSLSSYNSDEKSVLRDLDGSDDVTWFELDRSAYDTFSQEFQLLSGQEAANKWILGLFYYNEEADHLLNTQFENLFVAGGPDSTYTLDPLEVDATSLGMFGQIDFTLSDQLELVVGLRYNKDKKSMKTGIYSPAFGFESDTGGPVSAREDEDEEWEEVTGKIGVNYHYNEGVMLYGSISNGYKSGGFNLDQELPYDPERVIAYESGIKSMWLERRVQFNAAAFYYDYDDKQERKRNEVGFVSLVNAGTAVIKGVEVEGVFALTDSLQIDATVAYLDAEYDEFDSLDDINPDLGFQDLSGNKLPRSPEWKGHLGVQYDYLLGSMGNIVSRLDVSWVDEQYSNYFNREGDLLDSYTWINASIKWQDAEEHWGATLYVQNLEDDDIMANRSFGGGLAGSPQYAQFFAPRTYGMKVEYRF